MSDTIDVRVQRLLTVPDEELIGVARDYLANSISNTRNSLVIATCRDYKPTVALNRDSKTFVAIFVAFEELTREQRDVNGMGSGV